jgi:GH35 family endo-1,4-beta-xylanase
MIVAGSKWTNYRQLVIKVFITIFLIGLVSSASSAEVVLSASGGKNGIDLSWEVKGNLRHTQIYRDTDDNPHGRKRLVILGGDINSYADTTAVEGAQYWYWIKYTDTNNKVGSSNIASAVSANNSNINSELKCDNPISEGLPFEFSGMGSRCHVITGNIESINSWDMEKVEINGIDYTNSWSNQMPERINGSYFIYTVGNHYWSYLEVNGSSTEEDDASTLNVSVGGVNISPLNATLATGETTVLTASITPSNASNSNASWESSDTGVASVNQKGVVTGVSQGVATITVTTEDGQFSAASSIIVEAQGSNDKNSGEGGLKSLADFHIGVAVNAGAENNSIINSGTSSLQQAVVFEHFDQITAGNIMKMSYLHPSEDSFSFNQADELIAFAKQNGMSLHGHTLIWHSDYQVPEFMKNYNGDFESMLEKHVHTIASHFAGKVDSWDVVNEALADVGDNTAVNGFRNSLFYQKMGANYIDEAFKSARAADPGADLFYNDYSIENGDAKTENMLALVDGLLARDVPITGVGFQMHILSDWPSASVIESVLRAVADRGLKVKITELDVRVNNAYDSEAPVYASLTKEAAEMQKERYRQIVAAYLRAVPPELRAGITVWGVWDADSWLNTPEQPDWPLLFDDNFQAKPALQGFAEGLKGY